MLAGFAIVVLALLITVDVVIRNLGVGNFPWLLEVSEYTIYITTFLAAPWVLHLGAHVRVDLLVHAVRPGVGRMLEAATNILGAVISAFLVYHGVLVVTEAHALNAIVVKQLAVAEWLLLAAIPVSGCLLVLEFGFRVFRVLRGDDPAAPGADAQA